MPKERAAGPAAASAAPPDEQTGIAHHHRRAIFAPAEQVPTFLLAPVIPS